MLQLSTMGLTEWFVLFAIAGVCGAVGSAIAGYSHTGCLGAIALGFIGALLGPWLAHLLGLPELMMVHIGATRFPIIWAVIGSSLFSALVHLFRRRY